MGCGTPRPNLPLLPRLLPTLASSSPPPASASALPLLVLWDRSAAALLQLAALRLRRHRGPRFSPAAACSAAGLFFFFSSVRRYGVRHLDGGRWSRQEIAWRLEGIQHH